VCRFSQRELGNNQKMTFIRLNSMDDVIYQMADSLRTEIADHMYLQRSLRVYEGDSFWVIKSTQKRLWSQTAALNDADSVLREHMEAVVEG
jgi:hypothetical protein